jgi:hypothetical protein
MLMAAGAGLMLAGTAANAYGTYQRDQAQKRALNNYKRALGEHMDQEQGALSEQQGVLSGLARERQGGIGNYINEIGMAQRPGTDDGFAQRQTGVLNDVGKLTGGPASGFAYSGSPRTAAEGQQAGITQGRNTRMAEALLADHATRQIDEREAMAKHRLSLGELLRSNKGKTLQDRMTLAKSLRDLDWQKKTAAMQNQLDDASKQGQWLNLLGGLGTQAGGMAMMAGAGGADGGGGVETEQLGGLDPGGAGGMAGGF